jgi:hypothetical protein
MSKSEETLAMSPFERDKWETEKCFREREISVKEREQATKEAELALKQKEQVKTVYI